MVRVTQICITGTQKSLLSQMPFSAFASDTRGLRARPIIVLVLFLRLDSLQVAAFLPVLVLCAEALVPHAPNLHKVAELLLRQRRLFPLKGLDEKREGEVDRVRRWRKWDAAVFSKAQSLLVANVSSMSSQG